MGGIPHWTKWKAHSKLSAKEISAMALLKNLGITLADLIPADKIPSVLNPNLELCTSGKQKKQEEIIQKA
jgi:hypothetical protein